MKSCSEEANAVFVGAAVGTFVAAATACGSSGVVGAAVGLFVTVAVVPIMDDSILSTSVPPYIPTPIPAFCDAIIDCEGDAVDAVGTNVVGAAVGTLVGTEVPPPSFIELIAP
jgi:hypothetical protein